MNIPCPAVVLAAESAEANRAYVRELLAERDPGLAAAIGEVAAEADAEARACLAEAEPEAEP
jgi:hypothetical protein